MFANVAKISILFALVFSILCETSFSKQKDKSKADTPEEKVKLRQAEEFADRFARRWHETLDLNVLFDEMFVTDDGMRRKVGYGFGFFIDDWNEEIDEKSHEYAVKVIGDERARLASLGFLNLLFLSFELKLIYTEQEIKQLRSIFDDERFDELSKEISEWFQKRKSIDPDFKQIVSAEETERIRRIVNRFTEYFNHQISVYRAKLAPEFFRTEKYIRNLKKEYGTGSSEIVSSDDSIYEEMKMKREQRIYEVERGCFRLLITEEEGQFKILSLK